jgi:RHH-type proline utilization regulon transcriptional repressor/proline dehydrogenase/delta 1-pyrroline-5-carboxylate dehydrogenase
VSLFDEIEQHTQAIGREIFARLTVETPSVFQFAWWDEKILDWCMRDDTLKVQMFRFIDVLPMLKTSEQIARHLQEYFLDHKEIFPLAVQWGLNFASHRSAAARAVAMAVRRNVTRMAQRFIAGATPTEALIAIRKLRRQGQAFTLDLLGEATLSEAEAVTYQQRYLDLITSLAAATRTWEPVESIDTDHTGLIPRVNVSLKLTALYSQFDAIAPEQSAQQVKARLRPVLRTAKEVGAAVTVDMEQYRYKDLTLQVYKEILEEDEFRDWPHAGIVLQAYLRETEQDLRDLLAWVKTRGTPIGVRLVRGAYWDYETVIARQRGWPVPVFTRKWETDVSFERLVVTLLEHAQLLRPAIATHNVRSLAYALATARQLGLPERTLEFQMLYGMGDAIKAALVQLGQRLRVYAPFGELIPGMGYLVRRLLENTSNDSFLRQSFVEHTEIDELLRNPNESGQKGLAGPQPNGPGTPAEGRFHSSGFHNEPELDFAQADQRRRFHEGLEHVRQQLGQTYPLVINGQELLTGAEIVSSNPARPTEIIGRVARAGIAEADLSVEAAVQAFPTWRATPATERADFLFRAASLMRTRRHELAAWEVLEAGKPWREADADVCEAIDFLQYYGQEMIRLAPARQLDDLPGEINLYTYQPRGVAAVIAPWNFPLAILTGMTAAALVTGNTVIMKPAEQTSVIAAKLMEIFRSVDLPAGVLAYLPGLGEEVGEHLVTHPRVNVIAFTGSLAVGLRINALAAQTTAAHQRGIKRVIAEMGGKNAIIVDDDADLDEAVLGTVVSAFGYAGQKCSACSRVIVLKSVYPLFLPRLIEATRSLQVGPAEEPATFVPPLIDEEARQKVQRYIALAKSEGRVVLEMAAPPDGHYVGPVIVTEVDPQARIAQEEIFGPVLAVLQAQDFTEALTIALSTPYALTGGLYSRSPGHIEQARQEFRVGNLYLNRKITGALVGRQPFGGLGLSEIGSKAGGPDYLLQFMEPRVTTENTLRRGFAPLQR